MISDFDLFHQLQAEIRNSTTSVTDSLRIAKQLATRLDLKEDLKWMDLELNGYEGLSAEEIPVHRHLTGVPEYEHSTDGWKEIPFKNSNEKELYSHAVNNQPIGIIERMLKNSQTYAGKCSKALSDALARDF
jgi:hypothetical protein